MDYFVKEIAQPSIDPINTYGVSLTKALIRAGHSPDRSLEIAKKITSEREDPDVIMYHKDKHRDSVLGKTKLREYITSYVKKGHSMVPTGTTYNNNLRSPLGEMTKENKEFRNVTKALAKKLEKEGDIEGFLRENTNQNVYKIDNNSVSGATASPGTIFYNRTGHNTLTSMTSAFTSAGNILAETLLGGNRYYKTILDVQRHVNTICGLVDKEKVKVAIKEYSLKIPTDKDIEDILTISFRKYTWNKRTPKHIVDYVCKLSAVDRCIFAYHNDLLALLNLNEDMTLGLLRAMTDKAIIPNLDSRETLKDIPEHLEMQIRTQVSDIMKGDGRSLADIMSYKHKVNGILIDKDEELQTKDDKLVDALASMYFRSQAGFNYLKNYLDAFLLTDILPIGAHNVGTMIREVISLSDTDSTASTNNKWAKRVLHRNDIYCTDDKIIAALMTTFSSSILSHQLRLISKVINVRKSDKENIIYKNEFYFTTMAVSSKTKHYTAFTAIKEGYTYPEDKIDVKGVHLQSSKTIPKYLDIGYKLMAYFHDTVKDGNNVILEELLVLGDDINNKVKQNIIDKDTSLFSRNMIKHVDTYSNADKPASTPYFHVMFWKEIFNDKYDTDLSTPLLTRAIPVKLKKKKEMLYFAEVLGDVRGKKFLDMMSKYNKDGMTTINIPENVLDGVGLIPELAAILDHRRVLDSALKNVYIPLSSQGAREVRSLGFCGANPHIDFSKVDRLIDKIDFKF